MAKKKPDKKQAPAPRSMEQMMRDISRLLSERDFDSIDAMNDFLHANLVGGQPLPAPPRTNLDRAQDIIYEAQEARSKNQALKLVRQALAISPDCADAYVLLAELNAPTLAEAWAFYEAGVRAGERALGDEFEALKGHFWGHIETRPYMRARLGLAITLWHMDRLHEAADHMAALLALNPNDNQGVRDLYLTLLLELGDDQRIEQLLQRYPPEWSAYWKYNRALYAFRQGGAGDQADEYLSDAISYNPHVPPYLLGEKKLPKQSSVSHYSPGDANEALAYALDGIRPWSTIAGARDWLDRVFRQFKETDSEA